MWRYPLKMLVLPPAVNLLALLLAWWWWTRRPLLARLLAVLSVASLGVLAMPGVALELHRWHAPFGPLDAGRARAVKAQAIVVLGGGRARLGMAYRRPDEVNGPTLERLRHAAWLHRETGLPLLTTGGRLETETLSEAELMRATLARDFRVPVRWVEPHSRTTQENARFTADLLKPAEVRRVLLVSHASHLPRAMYLFARHGMDAVPAPTAYYTPARTDAVSLWIPDAEALLASQKVLHERLGLLWYAAQARFPWLDLPD